MSRRQLLQKSFDVENGTKRPRRNVLYSLSFSFVHPFFAYKRAFDTPVHFFPMGFNMLKITILALALAAVSSAKTLERGKFLSSETILYFFENSLVLQVL